MAAKDDSLRILQVHNEYYSGLGGEDTVVRLEREMLARRGHDVEQLKVSTSELRDAGPFKILEAAVFTPWSRRGYALVRLAIARYKPDILHVHNTFPLLSPSVYWAAQAAGVPVVQTYHNYRLACAAGTLYRDGMICDACLGHLPVPALVHRCYNKSLPHTAPLVAMQLLHRGLRTYETRIDAHIALTEFAKSNLVRAGLPAEKIRVKPNFTAPRVIAERQRRELRQFVFVGQIIEYKGVELLLEAWSRLQPANARLVIVGDGVDRAALEQRFPASHCLEWLGRRKHDEAMAAIDQSDFLVLPSRLFEGFPMVMLEAYAAGTPFIGPAHGAFPQLVGEGEDGFLFEPRNLDSLMAVLRRALALDAASWMRMSELARHKYNGLYTEEANYPQLMEIYGSVLRGTPSSDARLGQL